MDDLISRQAAIGIIQGLYPGMPRVPWLRKDWQERYEPYINAEKAIRTLPSAQPEPQWIPVSERLPEENVPVLLGVRFKDDFKFFVSARIDYNYWSGLGREIKCELRWMPLPEPYRAERRTDEVN